MTQLIPFLSPRMVGVRFAGHAIPLELLRDLATLEEMVIEVSKWRYLQENSDRRRAPKGFTDGIGLRLIGIGDGSAIPQISMIVESNQLVAPVNQIYFEQARNAIIGAIDAAEHDNPINQHLPDFLLGYFDRIGRGLRDGESIEFRPENTNRPARLNKATRRKLILASSQVLEFSEEISLRGAISEANQNKMTFELEVINGPRVTAPIATQHLPTVLEAFNGYTTGSRVLLQGIGRYNRNDRLQSIEAVEHITLLEANDIFVRLDEFSAIRHGWLDGKKGFAPSANGLTWLANCFKSYYPDDLPAPYLYPTAEGGVQAEWSTNTHEISLDIDIDSHQAQWHALNMSTGQDDSQQLDLSDPDKWQWLTNQLTQLSGINA
jgi:hypothetical protein